MNEKNDILENEEKIESRNRRLRIHKEGKTILISLFVLLVCINLIFHFWDFWRMGFIINLFVSVAAFSFFLFFFRNPVRQVKIDDESLVVAPADGRVVVIEDVEEYEYFEGKKMKQISIFMSPFNVHANWFPINGRVIYSKHHKGRHLAAYLPKSSHENEKATIVIESASGNKLLIRQIAGAMARRIVTYAAPNHLSQLNHHLGFIKFGSRVDVLLPLESEIFVALAEKTKGNETIIARLPD